jgi:hypothetical protein
VVKPRLVLQNRQKCTVCTKKLIFSGFLEKNEKRQKREKSKTSA